MADAMIKALKQGHEICVIPVVYYEFLRGFERKGDLAAIDHVKQFWRTISYYEGTKLIWDEAVRWCVITIRQNTMPGERDLFIAAFAIQLNATIVTRNERHFSMFPLSIENWIDD